MTKRRKPGPQPLPKRLLHRHRLPVMLNDEEQSLVRRLARKWSCSAAEVMRRLLRAAGEDENPA